LLEFDRGDQDKSLRLAKMNDCFVSLYNPKVFNFGDFYDLFLNYFKLSNCSTYIILKDN